MLKIEFPAENKALAAAIGRALSEYAGCAQAPATGFATLALVEGKLPDETDPRGPAPTFDELQNAGTATGADDDATGGAPADGRKDQKGVVYNPTFCANAKEPFYSSGAMLGQWKKARGCDQGAYDAWYANELGKVQANWQEKSADLGVNTSAAAAAFSGQAAANTQIAPVAPTTGGELMKWVSERQAANVLTQADIDAAWAATGFGVADLFGANAPAAIGSVHGVLSAKVGA